MDTWAPGRHRTTVDAVLQSVDQWLTQADGITISGGEPFDQPSALEELLKGLRARSAADILVYSGYPLENIGLERLEGLIDALITDPFRVDQPQTLALRGSNNQRLVCLTALGHARFNQFERRVSQGERTLDVMFDGPNGEIFLAGIPARGDLKRLAALLESQGHTINTTEDVRDYE
jgi:anaerobic ribonucleoside-triphosphate reductase activating protein